MAEINTTPLVDVMLVLLVIFIITAPLFHQAVPIDLPKVDATQARGQAAWSIQLAIDEQGRSTGTARRFTAMHWRCASRQRARTTRNCICAPTAPRATRSVAEVMAAAQQAGIVKIAFVTDPAQR